MQTAEAVIYYCEKLVGVAVFAKVQGYLYNKAASINRPPWANILSPSVFTTLTYANNNEISVKCPLGIAFHRLQCFLKPNTLMTEIHNE